MFLQKIRTHMLVNCDWMFFSSWWMKHCIIAFFWRCVCRLFLLFLFSKIPPLRVLASANHLNGSYKATNHTDISAKTKSTSHVYDLTFKSVSGGYVGWRYRQTSDYSSRLCFNMEVWHRWMFLRKLCHNVSGVTKVGIFKPKHDLYLTPTKCFACA